MNDGDPSTPPASAARGFAVVRRRPRRAACEAASGKARERFSKPSRSGAFRTPVALLTVALALAGCDGPSPDATAAAALQPLAVAYGDGAVVGRVSLDGPPPPRPVLDVACCAGARPIRDDAVVVDDNGGVADVFVWLEGGPAVDGSALPPALLDQRDCRYVPHAVGVVVGQPLDVRNSDPTFHNVHVAPRSNPPANLAMPADGGDQRVSFAAPELIRVGCDVHPWMGAWVGVFANPHFAVTGTGGGFRIGRVPPGAYTLVARHEWYGEVRRPVTVPADGPPAELTITYRPPDDAG